MPNHKSIHRPVLYCRSGSHKLLQAAKQTSPGLLVARQATQSSSRLSALECCCLGTKAAPETQILVAGLKQLYSAGHLQNSRQASGTACRTGTSTCCRAQQRHSSDPHSSPYYPSSSHQQHGSDQHIGICQHEGPDISLLSSLLQRQWDHAKNAHLGNTVIKPYSGRKVWWRCDQCPLGHAHAWDAHVYSRSRGRSCPFCANKRVCQHNSLANKRPDIAAEFSDRNQGTAHDYTAGSAESVFWQCNHGHEWHAPIMRRTILERGCPECFASRNSSQPKQKHPVLADSQHAMLQYWDSEMNTKEGLSLNDIKCRSMKICHWVCHCCPKGQPHRWQVHPGALYVGHACPCCSGHKACICNSLQSLFPEVAAEWDYSRNTGTPADYAAYSNSRVWWHTNKRGSFHTRIQDRTSFLKRRAGAKEARRSHSIVSHA